MAVTISGTDGITTPQINAGNIVGEVGFFARSTAPEGWLKANGAAVSRTTFADLFAEIGTTYGVGDGSTTFALPDMRGEFPRGWDDGRGVDSGRSFGSDQTDAFQGHFHESFRRGTVANTGTQLQLDSQDGNSADTLVTPSRAREPIADSANGTPRTASETRPRNVALLACIKF